MFLGGNKAPGAHSEVRSSEEAGGGGGLQAKERRLGESRLPRLGLDISSRNSEETHFCCHSRSVAFCCRRWETSAGRCCGEGKQVMEK